MAGDGQDLGVREMYLAGLAAAVATALAEVVDALFVFRDRHCATLAQFAVAWQIRTRWAFGTPGTNRA